MEPGKEGEMRPKLRSFIGMLLLVALVVIYAILAVTVASARLGGAHWTAHLAFFAISGALWVLPAMGIVKWMAGPAAQRQKR